MAISPTWAIVGYSLPEYDELVRKLFVESSVHGPAVHVFNPDPQVADRFSRLLQGAAVYAHPGLPEVLLISSQTSKPQILAALCNRG
jgi:hypothetical protein